MKVASVAVLTAILAAAAPAHAEPDESKSEAKSETTAFTLSLGGTLASASLMAYGLSRPAASGVAMFDIGLLSTLITPSLGHFYAGDIWTAGLGMRAAGGAVALVGVAQALGCLDTEDTCNFVGGGGLALTAGGVLAAAGAFYDIATAPKAARRYNAKHVSLVPASPGANVGLSIAGQF